MNGEPDKYRPPVEERWIEDRVDPVSMRVRTRFLYSERDPRMIVPEGRTRHAFGRSGMVVASDVPSPGMDVCEHVRRAVELFGDDADLVITVARAEPGLHRE